MSRSPRLTAQASTAAARDPVAFRAGIGTHQHQHQHTSLRPISLAVCLLLAGPSAWALPQGAVPSFGQATVQQTTPGTLLIQQSSPRAGLDWSSFSIAAGERVNIVQPSATAVLLNRVVGNDPSLIQGALNSNGSVWLINPRGIVFGAGSRVDVGGLLASTLNLSQPDAASGRIQLSQGSTPAAEIRAEGQITASHGAVVLVAPQVQHSGSVLARRVGLAAASDVLVDVEGDGLVFFQVQNRNLQTRLNQLGQIRVDGGTADFRAAARAGFADTVLNLEGVVQARGLGQRGGRIFIDGGEQGITRVAGTLDATASSAAGAGAGAGAGVTASTTTTTNTSTSTSTTTSSSSSTTASALPTHPALGGDIWVQGDKVLLEASARLDVSGSAGGGGLRVGGDFQGSNPGVRNASMVTVRQGARLAANALDQGNGGTLIVWSNVATRFAGQADARGGHLGGDGGLVEVSGKHFLDFKGSSDRSAPKGRAGTLLLDPSNITVQLDSPDIGDDGNADDLVGPLLAFADPGNTSRITAGAVVAQLNAGNVTLQAENDITVTSAINASTAAAVTSLTLRAGNNITINAPVSVRGDLVLSASDAGATPASNVGRVVNSAALLAGGNIAINTASATSAHGLGASLGANTLSVIGGVELTNNATWTLAANTTLGGLISGAGGLSKAGAGVLTLAGLNTYTGSTTLDQGGLLLNSALASGSVNVNAGTLTLGAANLLPTSAALSVANGATLSVAASNAVASLALAGTLSGGAALSVSGATTLNSGQVNSPLNTGTLVHSAGNSVLRSDVLATTTAVVGAGTLTVGDGATAGSLSAGTSVSVAAGAVLNYRRSDNIDIGSVLGNGTLRQSGSGRLRLDGTATAPNIAALEVDGGQLALGDGDGNRINNAANVRVASGATLTLGDSSETVGTLTLAGTLAAPAASVLSATTITLQTGALVNAELGSGSLGVTGNASLNRSTAATTLTVSSGTLTLGNANFLANGATVTVNNGAGLVLGGNETTAALNLAGSLSGAGTFSTGAFIANGPAAVLASSLSVSGNASVSSGSLTVGDGATSGSLAVSGTLSVSSGAELAFNRSDNIVLNESVAGNGTLRQAGSGSLTFNGSANNLSALLVTGAGGQWVLGTGSGTRIGNSTAVTVGPGATFTLGDNDESVGAFSLAGTLAGSQRLNAGATTLLTGALVNANLGSGSVTVSGSATFNGSAQGDITVGASGALTLGPASGLSNNADISVVAGGLLTLGRDENVNRLTLAGTLAGGFTLSTDTGNGGGSILQTGAVVSLGSTLAGGTVTVNGDAALNGRSIAPLVRINTGGTLRLGATPDRLIDSSAVSFPNGGTASTRVLQLALNETIDSLSGSGTVQGPGSLSSSLLSLTGDNFNNSGSHNFDTLTSSGISSITNGTVNVSGSATVLDGVLTVGNGSTSGQLLVAGSTTLSAGATLAYNRSGLVTLSNSLLGPGTLRQVGSGELRLSGSAAAALIEVINGSFSLSLGNDDRLANTAAVSVASGATLTLNNASETVGSLTVAGTVNGTGTLNANSVALNTGAVVGAPLGAGSLTVGGNSTLGGTSAASTVTINAGTLSLGSAQRLLSTAALNVANGAALRLNGDQDLATLDLAGALNRTGATDRLNAGGVTLQTGAQVNADLGSATLTVLGNSTLNASASATTVAVNSGTLILGSANRLASSADVVVAAGAGLSLGGDQTVNTLSSRGSVAGSGQALQANSISLDTGANIGANLVSNTITVLGNTSVSGSLAANSVAINAGTLSTSANNRLAAGANVSVAAAAALSLAGNEAINSLVLAGNISGNGRTLNANTYTLQSGSTASANLGTGALTVAGNSSLSGTAAVASVDLAGGTLTLGAAGRLTAAPVVTGGGTLVLGGAETLGSLAGNGSVNTAGFSLSTGAAGSTTYGGSISGSGALNKLGAATTFTLSSAQAYSGNTGVNQGRLVLAAAEVLNNASSITVASGATLQLAGSETVASLTLAGTLAGTGTLSASSQTLNGGNTVLGADLGAGVLSSSGVSSLGGRTAASALTVGGGNLALLSAQRLANSANVTVASGATLTLGGSEQVASLSISGTLAGSGNTLQAASYSLGAGAVINADLGSGVLTVLGSSALNGRALAPSVNISSGTLTLGPLPDRLLDTASVTVAAAAALALSNPETVASLTLAGVLNGSGLTLTTSGNTTLAAGATVNANLVAATLDVNGSTSLTGTVGANTININSGRLSLTAPDRLADSATVNLASGAELLLAGDDRISTLNLGGSLLGSGTLTAATTQFNGGTAVANLGGALLVSSSGGILSGSAAATTVQINGGVLTLAGSNRLSAQAAVDVASGATLVLGGDHTLGPLSGSGGVNLGSHTLTLGGAVSSSFSGTLAGSGNLVKQGSGSFTLGGSPSYGGSTTVAQGNLVLANADVLPDSSSVQVASGASLQLGGNDRVASLTLAGTLSGTGLLSAPNYTLQSGVVSATAGLGAGALVSVGTSRLAGTSAADTVNVDSGSLTLDGANRLSSGAQLSVAASATLALNAANSVDRLTLAGTLGGSGQSLSVSSGVTLQTGAQVLANLLSPALLVTGSANLSGTFGAGSGGGPGGASSPTLSVSAGTLTLASANRLADNVAVTVASGATLALNGDDSVSSLNLSGTLDGLGSKLSASQFTLQSGASVLANLGNVGSTTLNVTGSSSLSGSADADFVNVNAGTLSLSAANRLSDTADVSVASGATLLLAGDDRVGSLSLSGTLGGFGVLTASQYNLTGGVYNLDLGGGTLSSTGNSRLNGVSAATRLNVNGGTLTLGSADRFSAAPLVTVASGADMVLGGDQTFGSLAGAGTVNLASFTLNTGSGGDSTFAGVLAGAGGLVKQGGSTFTLAGNNSYLGPTRVAAGTLAVQGNLASTQLQVDAGTLALGAAHRLADAAAVAVASGARLTLAGDDTVGSLALAGDLSGTGRLTAANYALNGGMVNTDLGTGVLTSTGTSAINGSLMARAVSVGSGSLTLGSQAQLAGTALQVAAGATLNLGTDDAVGALAGGGAVNLSSFNLNVGLDGAGDSSFAGTLAGSGGLIKTGSVSLTLSGTNSYTGSTRVLAGTLRLAGASASQAVVVGPGAVLELGAGDLLHDSSHLNVQSGGSARLAGNDRIGSLAVAGTLGGNGQLTAATYELDNGTVNADLGAGALVSAGASALNGRSAANTVFVGRGTLTLGSANRLTDAAAVTVFASAALALNGNNTVASLALDGSLGGSGTFSAGSYALDGGTVNTPLGGGALQSRGNSLINSVAAVDRVDVINGLLTLGAATRLSAAPALTLGASAGFELGGDQTLGSLAGAGRVALNSFTLSTGVLGDSVYTGVISGSGGLTKLGSSTFTLASFQPNNFTGATRVLAGTLATGAGNVLAGTSALTVAPGASLTLGGNDSVASLSLSGTLGGSGILSAASYALTGGTVNADLGSGSLSSAGSSQLNGRAAVSSVMVSDGTLVLGAPNRFSALPALEVATGARLQLAGEQTLGSLSGGGSVDLGSFTLSTGQSADSQFAGTVVGAGGLVKQGGTTFTLSGANTYSGSTWVQAGTLRVGDGTASGSVASSAYQLDGTLRFERSDTVQLAQPVSGPGGIEQAGSGQLRFSGSNKTFSGNTVVLAGELSTSAAGDLSSASSVSVATGARLSLVGAQAVKALQADGSVQLDTSLAATQDLLLVGAVSSSGAASLSGQRISAVNDGNLWGGPLSLQAQGPLALSSGRSSGLLRDLVLGNISVASGGRIDAGSLLLSAPVLLSGGSLELVAASARTAQAPDASILDKRAASLPIAFAADVVQQGANSSLTVNSGAGLKISATGGGSVQLLAASNSVAGALAVISGSGLAPWSADATSASFAGLPTQNFAVQSRVRLAGSQINIGGGQLAAGTAGEAGILADVVQIRADKLSTLGPGSGLVARLPFDSTIGTVTSLPALTLELTPQSYALSFPFGGTGDAALRVNVGSQAWGNRALPLNAGYIAVLPRGGARGTTAVLLSGPPVVLGGYRFFVDGAGVQSEIPVLYNGVLPNTPQVESSISATVAVSENARKDRFDESVRTENVTVRLRNGVIAEVGPAPSATQGTQGALPPPSCTPAADKLSCAAPVK